jgi:hypothetical protein
VIEQTATLLFALAILHTFSVSLFQRWARNFREGSFAENLFHLLGEVEVVFGLWAAAFIGYFAIAAGKGDALTYLKSCNFTEPAFVFAIMVVASTKPILDFSEWCIRSAARFIPLAPGTGYFVVAFIVGPVLGSLITEPAAMTVVALLLARNLFHQNISSALKYSLLGLLFVNISIGGTLTHFAAPPVVMVAAKWGWTTPFIFSTIGYKSLLAITVSTLAVGFWFRNELKKIEIQRISNRLATPVWVILVHGLFLAAIVLSSHHMVVFLPVLLFFVGFAQASKEYQAELEIKRSLLVGFFLSGLVVFGGMQGWWLAPLLSQLTEGQLYFGATGLTAIADNAAITYLGSQVPGLSDAAKFALVAGSVTGGGLTVIANAPNPAGYGILNSYFGPSGINPIKLFAGAAVPTFITILFLWFLP